MCSLVEIKNHDEIYIHYLSGERGNVQKITIVGDGLKNKEDDNNNLTTKDVLITHKNKDVNGEEEEEDRAIDLPVKDSEDSEQTSDRASSMGSSVTGEENGKDLKDLKSPPEDVKDPTVGGETTEAGSVEVAKPVKAKVKCREMATQVEQPMKGKGSLVKNKTGKSVV